MDIMTIDQLIMDFMCSNAQQDEDIISYKLNVKVLLENLIIKYDQDIEYQRDLEEQVDNLEIENIDQDKCIARISTDAKNAIDECKCGANDMAEKMMSTVKLLQIENDFLQDKCIAAVESTEKLKLQRLAELQVARLLILESSVIRNNTDGIDYEEICYYDIMKFKPFMETITAMTAVATAFENKLGNLQKQFRVMAQRLNIAEEKINCDSILKIATEENVLKSDDMN